MPLRNIHHERSRALKAAAKPAPSRPAARKERTPRPPPPELMPPPTDVPAAEEAAPIAAAPTAPASSPPPPELQESPAPGAPAAAGADFERRFDAAQTRLQTAGPEDPVPALLDRALTLLESISQHPALRDYGATQRQLEEIEQRLGAGAYPQ